MLGWPKQFAQKARNIISEKMFYSRKLLKHGVGQTLAGDYANIENLLSQFSGGSTSRISLLEGKIQNAASLAMQVQKTIQHGETVSQDELKEFVEKLLEELTTED
jgi:hypothetical protein